MTNTLNTPVEVIEQEYPLQILEYSIRKGSGGNGRFKGGEGICRRYRFLEPATVTLLTERRTLSPYGLYGGSPGSRGLNLFFSARSGKEEELSGKTHVQAETGDILTIMTPGGGGIGGP
jgi:N-methylhydantoinase B